MVSLNTIAAAAARGLHFRLAGDKLVVRGSPEHEPLALRILAEKDAFVALLRAHPEFAGEDGLDALVERLEERAAIREYDGGLPRAEAEQLAFEDVFVERGAAT